MRGRVVVVGDLVNDIVVVPKGTIVPDTDNEALIQPRPGGSAANTAAWLGSLGAPTDFVGCVGSADADVHAELFREGGVTAHLQVEPGLPTGTIVILVRGEERTMLTERGANAAFSRASVSNELLAGAAVVHVSGYTIAGDYGLGAARDIIRRALALGTPVSVTTGSVAYLAQFGAENFLAAITGAHILIATLAEGRLLTAVEDPMEVGKALLAHVPIVIITRGSRGAILFQRDALPVEVPAPPIAKLIDPTGAGDALAAGFLAHWVTTSNPEAALRSAVLVAARAVMLIGGRPPV
jgi:sugar/nucleoside kinase (ribokinase family)